MISTEDDKAFVKIFVPYYRLWTTESIFMKEFPGKRRNTFGSCLKAHASSCALRRLCVSLTSDAIGYSD